jgi:UDP-glucuronate decarboxylase
MVTGGGGFLGSHLCERLIARGDRVICVDNFYTGRLENLAPLISNYGFHVIHQDVVDPFYADVDQIYHLACPASPRHYQRNPVRTLRTAFEGTRNVLDLGRASKAKVLIASTSEVYGDPQVHPQTEDYWGHVNPIGKRACYDEGKRSGEALATAYAEFYGVDVRIARIFNTYGPRMLENDGRVVSNFVLQALAGEPITIYGDGTQTRSFCFVTDLVAGLMALMDLAVDLGPVNLGNPEETTIEELAHLVCRMCRSSSDIVYQPLPSDDPVRRRPNILLAQACLGWTPRVSLRAGLQQTLAYFAKRRIQVEPSRVGAGGNVELAPGRVN